MTAGRPAPDSGQREHDLRCWPGPFAAVLDGSKPYEIRVDDRGYAVGDVLRLREWDPDQVPHATRDYRPRGYTGREVRRVVTHVLEAGTFGLRPGYVALGLAAAPAPGDQLALPGDQPALDDDLREQIAAWMREHLFWGLDPSRAPEAADAVLALPGLRRLADADSRAAELAALLLAARADVEHLAAERDRAEQTVRRVRDVLAYVEAKRDRYDEVDPESRDVDFDKGRAWAYDVAAGRIRRALDGGEQS